MIESVKLKNGAEEAEPLVRIVMMSLQKMQEDVAGITLFYDLVMRCRNPQSEMWDSQLAKLKEWALLEQDGQPHDSIQNIVESAVVGEELQMQLQNPIAELS